MMQTNKLAYVLSVMSESQAMAVRINEQWRNQAGYAAYFIQRVAQQVVRKMPAAWAKHIPETDNSSHRLLRSTVWAWDDLRACLSRVEVSATKNRVDWLVLLAGLGLVTVTSWLRALALELEADGQWPMPFDIDLAVEWEIEDAVLSQDQNINSVDDLVELFKNESLKPTYNDLDNITPLGWLVLVAGRMGLIGQNTKMPFEIERVKTLSGSNDDSSEAIRLLRNKIKSFARSLVLPVIDVPNSEQWPFDYVADFLGTGAFWGEKFVNEAFVLLADLEYLCVFEIIKINDTPWRFEPRDHKFTDADGITWKFQPWQIILSDGAKPVAFEQDGRYLSHWTETRNKDNRLLNVSAIGQYLGKFVSKQLAAEREYPEFSNTSIQSTSLTFGEEQSTNQYKTDIPPHNKPEHKDSSINTSAGVDMLRKSWLDSQNIAWNLRKHRPGNHVRLAFMQWKVDDSYRHPLFELAMPTELEKAWFGKTLAGQRKKKRSDLLKDAKEDLGGMPFTECHNKVQFAQALAEADRGSCWACSEMLPSWAEHRRRKLLEEALRACNNFGVNVLVLPEYSVRPDTVKWLKEKLEKTDSQVTILAGTYRLYGCRNEAGFEACYSEILGVTDFENIRPNERIPSEELMSSGERSAILSLLLPINHLDQSLVSVFTRRKKYPAMGANEIFNPGIEKWQPLFTFEALLNDLKQRDLHTGRRLKTSSNEIPANDFLKLLGQVNCERYLAELICSELFVITNPANWNNIASEYNKLLKRFGSSKNTRAVKKAIQEDLWEFARYLGISGVLPLEDKKQRSSSGVDIPRRSIILLPAMTSRSADYWIFGQSALLAAGITTVFCNAVADKDSVGGSCVIGRESWKDGKRTPGISSLITPYSGWSRGIYYNEKNDALGEKEQAMVIVDIDPVHMMEGKPRPQALPVPLQLVAHLPIAETINWKMKDGKIELPFKSHNELSQFVKKIEEVGPKSHLSNPATMHEEGKTLYELAKDLAPFFGNEKENGKFIFEHRLNKWNEDWREFPFAGRPPAIMDWLWVDLTPPTEEKGFPDIFVPPWGSAN